MSRRPLAVPQRRWHRHPVTQRLTSMLSNGALGLALVSLLTSMVHLGVVRHERCAEHGELIEVVAAAHDLHAELGDLATTDTLDATTVDRDRHDHCSLATTHSALTAEHAMVHVAAIAGPAAGLLAATGRVTVCDDVLADAPKQGPPTRDV